MTDQTTMIVTSTPDPEQPDALQEYVQGVMPLLLGIGGKPLKRSMVSEAYLGIQNFSTLLVMDFPSKQELKDLFNSDAYLKLIPSRNKAFQNIEIMFAHELA